MVFFNSLFILLISLYKKHNTIRFQNSYDYHRIHHLIRITCSIKHFLGILIRNQVVSDIHSFSTLMIFNTILANAMVTLSRSKAI